MSSYVSEDTGLPVIIMCRFDEPQGKPLRPAVALQGQWQGGDQDIEPHWVPVCAEHDALWHVDYDTDETMPGKYRLPRFALVPDPEEVVIQPGEFGGLELRCPSCGEDTIAERDKSERWNRLDADEDATGEVIVNASLGDTDHQHDGYVCMNCQTELTLPDSIDIEDFS